MGIIKGGGHTRSLTAHSYDTPIHTHTCKGNGKGVLLQQERADRDLQRADTHTISHGTLVTHTHTHSYTQGT